MPEYLLSCDWGTTSFRLRLLRTADQALMGEITSADGMRSAYQSWQDVRETGVGREAFYRKILTEKLELLAKQTARSITGTTILMSGMASSSIGLQEIPYVGLPFSLDGSDARMQHMDAQDDFPHEIVLFSGVKSENDVMRGEETELIGLAGKLGNMTDGNLTFIFPGTHSKHLHVQGGKLLGFKTYMTGEIFNVLSQHTILKDSVDIQSTGKFSEPERVAFRQGVEASGESNILNSLFTVRTNQLFDKLTKKQNGMYLSGLLIGSEMRQLEKETRSGLVLSGGKNLYKLYQAAIDALGLAEKTIVLPAGEVDLAAIKGQVKIFEHLKLTNVSG